MSTLLALAKGLPVLMAAGALAGTKPPTDKSTPVEQRLAAMGPNSEHKTPYGQHKLACNKA